MDGGDPLVICNICRAAGGMHDALHLSKVPYSYVVIRDHARSRCISASGQGPVVLE